MHGVFQLISLLIALNLLRSPQRPLISCCNLDTSSAPACSRPTAEFFMEIHFLDPQVYSRSLFLIFSVFTLIFLELILKSITKKIYMGHKPSEPLRFVKMPPFAFMRDWFLSALAFLCVISWVIVFCPFVSPASVEWVPLAFYSGGFPHLCPTFQLCNSSQPNLPPIYKNLFHKSYFNFHVALCFTKCSILLNFCEDITFLRSNFLFLSLTASSWMEKSLCCGFCGLELVRQGEQGSDWLVWRISVGTGSQGLSLVARYLALRLLGERDRGLECETRRKRLEYGLWIRWFAFERCTGWASCLLSLGTG